MGTYLEHRFYMKMLSGKGVYLKILSNTLVTRIFGNHKSSLRVCETAGVGRKRQSSSSFKNILHFTRVSFVLFVQEK